MSRISFVLAIVLSACGGGSDSGTCASASSVLCDRACECGAPQCKFGDGSGGSVSFDTKGDCVAFLNLGCSGSGAQGIDFQACEDDAAAAACVGSGSDKAFASPASCDNGQ